MVEELLALLRAVVDTVAAEKPLLFGSYSIPHGSALSPSGIPCFLSSLPAMQGALEFAQVQAPIRCLPSGGQNRKRAKTVTGGVGEAGEWSRGRGARLCIQLHVDLLPF